ncbi:hypothetical protein [Brachyspira murdochii]|uniref:Uncharacterized protein n=2 Tax=Brachyspira murdochii TaxID=84378 RepID=D5U8D8_BRAM5|nr:hypothetical protein [Brachyspira murdochii]ADG70961.1 hypothetical protein Bmur_0862 [Brachyspira murdochii DSM 12563]PPS22822.1 hypothetical protein DJ52_02800 [Brachyspira murdochii]
MKLHEMMQFKSKIERRKHYFDLPSLPDREWQYMLQRAKMESSKKNEFNPFYAFMCSARLSFALSSAIVLALVLSLLYSTPQDDTNIKTNTASTTRNNINVVNVANSSFI